MKSLNPWHYKFSFLYLCMIPLINWAFSHSVFYDLPDGGKWSPFSIVVGLILVVRDFSQREIGHWVFIPLVVGVILSYFLAPPAIAIASAVAFLCSECCDWAVFTYTRKPLSSRVLYSCAVGVPIDTIVYLYGANLAFPGIFTGWMLGSMLVSKMIGAVVVYYMLRARERKQGVVYSPR